LNHAILTLPE
jgi:hypothetical protein